MRTEAEAGATGPQAKVPAAPGSWEPQGGPSPRAFGGAWPCWHLGVRLPASRTSSEEVSAASSCPGSCWSCATAAPGHYTRPAAAAPSPSLPSPSCPVHVPYPTRICQQPRLCRLYLLRIPPSPCPAAAGPWQRPSQTPHSPSSRVLGCDTAPLPQSRAFALCSAGLTLSQPHSRSCPARRETEEALGPCPSVPLGVPQQPLLGHLWGCPPSS